MVTLYFDVWGVLIPDHFGSANALEIFRKLSKRHGFDPLAAYEIYTQMQPSLDLGQISLSDLCKALGVQQQDFERDWLALHPADETVVRIIERLQAEGHSVGLATNFCRQLLNLLLENIPSLSLVLVWCSCDIGFVKPSKEFFIRTNEIVHAPKVVFIDDRRVNLRPATNFGGMAIPARGAWLRQLENVLPPKN